MNNEKEVIGVVSFLIILGLVVLSGGIYFFLIHKSPITQVSMYQQGQVVSTGSQATTTVDSQIEATSISTQNTVTGMSKYTDSSFGFSFWHPTTWTVQEVPVQNKYIYAGGTVTKQLHISNGKSIIVLEEFTSPTFSITDSTGVGACPVCAPVRYYFDRTLHTWEVQYPEGMAKSTSTEPYPAQTTYNTMGGLHMFYGSERFGANVIVPLSARNFVIVSVDGALATDNGDAQALTKTILALDPSVATPLSEEEQISFVYEEAWAYDVLSTFPLDKIPATFVLSPHATIKTKDGGSDSYDAITLDRINTNSVDITYRHSEVTCVLCALYIYKRETEHLTIPLGGAAETRRVDFSLTLDTILPPKQASISVAYQAMPHGR